MLKNYLIVALRNLKNHMVYSVINVSGLAVGLALCILVMVYVQDELSYDTFHEHADRIYRIAQLENQTGRKLHYMRIGGGITTRLKNDFPRAVEKRVRLMPAGQVWTKIGDKLFHEKHTYLVDETFFEIFSFPFINGDSKTALKEPNSVVISETTAFKYFSSTHVVGKMVKIDIPRAPLLKITGVIKDAPRNSHFHPDLIISLATIRNERNAHAFERMFGNTFWSYILVHKDYPVENLESQLPGFLQKHLNETEKKRIVKIYLQPLPDIHLYSSSDPFTEIEPENTGNITFLYVFSAIAFLVLVVACINFMNLATARSISRAREVGLRKVNGATRGQVALQFISESILVTLLAVPVALTLARVFMPLFNAVAGKEMSMALLNNPVLLVGLVLMVIFVGLVSGSYPALFLSSFQPVYVLKGKQGTRGSSGSSGLLRKILVVSQFTVSIGFVIAAFIVLRQMNFMTDIDLGYKKENVAVLPVILPIPAQQRITTMEFLKNEYLQLPGVVSVCAAAAVPTDLRAIRRVRPEGQPKTQNIIVAGVAVDYDFLKTMEIEILEGRNFSKEFTSDVKSAFLVNEGVVRELGLKEPIGKRLIMNEQKGTIIGVFKSPHWEPKRREMAHMLFYMNPAHTGKLVVRLNPNNVQGTLAAMERKWKEKITSRPFQYDFLEKKVATLYRSEIRFSRLIIYFTILTIFVACLGLFGLASFTAEQRTKEIGIRKVLGASTVGVVALLGRQFGKLILIANVIAWPLAYYAMQKWLQNFYYRTGIGIDVFVLSAVLMVVIAFITISYQSVKASLANPIDALRFE